MHSLRFRRPTLLLLLLFAGAFSAPPAGDARAAAPGQLDPAFGGSGVIELPAGTTVRDAAVQRDGKLVVVGSIGGQQRSRMMVARFDVSGALDRTFGGGIVSIPLPRGASRTVGNAVALARAGRIVVAGDRFWTTGADGMFVARLKADGTLDRQFGKGGAASLNRGKKAGGANDVALRRDGSIVLGGSAIGRRTFPVATLAQLTAGGRPKRPTRHYEVGQGSIERIALQRDGRAIFVGTRRNDQVTEAIIGRARTNGAIDTRFGGGVRARSYARRAASSGLRDVAVLPNGTVVATGYAFTGTGPGVRQITARFTKSGRPQRSFSGDGVVYTSAARSTTIRTDPPGGGAALAVRGSRLYLGGSWDENAVSALSVQAQTASGKLRRGFGTSGRTITPIRSFSAPAYGRSLAVSGAGVYLLGTAGQPGSESGFGVIARYGG